MTARDEALSALRRAGYGEQGAESLLGRVTAEVGKGTREGELTRPRAAARSVLTGRTDGDLPEWRTCYSTDGSDEPTGIAPVCLDEEHEENDGGVYACCADPVVEVESYAVASYMVALLNADRRGGDRG